MASSFWNLVNNLSEGIHKTKCKFVHEDKKCETRRSKYNYLDCFVEYTNFKDDLIECKCFCCSRNYENKFNKKLKKRFLNTNKFSNQDNNKLILLLWKRVYPYELIDDWEKFYETSLPEKEDIYSHLNTEDITDSDYAHPKKSL